ncbi:MAG TPA: hypothetical protein VFO51_05490 [Sphingomicrobium sp.]|nr:hypothetical protein [Sphingomicrobium sp.]
MRKAWLVFMLGLAGAAFASGEARAAGFDCSKASAPDERAVCANPRLSALDSQMTGLWYAYSRVPMLMGSSGNRQDEAEAFLARRRQCGSDVTCISSAYSARIATLESEITSSMNAMAPLVTGGCPQP